MIKKTIILFILLLLGNLSAQPLTTLRIGTIINGNLQPDQEIWYSVTATENGILTVETVGNLYTNLGFYDKKLRLIKEDFTSGNGNNASINVFTVRRSTYLFKLTGGTPDESGAFRIFAASSPMPLITNLNLEELKESNIRGKEENWFKFQATQSGILTIETQGDTDTILKAFSENLVLLSEDDDSGEELNSRLELLIMQGKTYYFIVTGHHDGIFQIKATNIKDLPTITPLLHSAQGHISPEKEDWYSVKTKKGSEFVYDPFTNTTKSIGGLLTVETNGNTNTVLYAYNELFELIAFDDNGGTDLNSRIQFTIRPNQTYFFKVTCWLDSSGDYSITAKEELF